MQIPFNDLSLQHKEIAKEIKQVILRTLKNNDYILGDDVRLFEKEFASFCGCPYAVGVSSGTAALFLALKAIGVKEGDEVIVPAFTYIATAFAVSYTGAKPVFADVDENTFNIDVAKLERLVNPNTKAIIPVHLFGQPADMAAVMDFAARHKLKVIEDAAQAHGARIKLSGRMKPVGGIGNIGCFSFYPSKNMGALGDAGIVVTGNQEYFDRLKMLRNYGRVSRYEHALIGYNSRLDTLQAGALRVKLKKIDRWNDLRRKAALAYNKYLSEVEGLSVPFEEKDLEHIYHAYVIKVKNRDKVADNLRQNGVPTMVYYPIALHLQKAYSSLGYKQGDFPVSERLCQEVLALPIFPHIKESQIRFIAGIIRESLK